MRELRSRMLTDIALHWLPAPFVIANLFTLSTDWKNTLQNFDFSQGTLEGHGFVSLGDEEMTKPV